MLPSACGGDGKPSESDGEDEDEDGAEGEVGEGEADERDDAEGAVLPAIAVERGGDACGNGRCDADDECGERESEGVGITLQDEVSDGVVQTKGLAEVGVEDSAPVVGVLLEERSVEAVGVAQGVDVGGSGAFAEHLDDGVAGNEVNEKEDDGDDDPEHRKGEEDAAQWPPESGSGHCVASLLSSSYGTRSGSLSGSTLMRLMRWPVISATVKRRP